MGRYQPTVDNLDWIIDQLAQLRLKLDDANRRAVAAAQVTELQTGTVDSAYASGQPKVKIPIGGALSAAGLRRLSSYTPAANDTVAVAQINGEWIVLGKLI